MLYFSGGTSSLVQRNSRSNPVSNGFSSLKEKDHHHGCTCQCDICDMLGPNIDHLLLSQRATI